MPDFEWDENKNESNKAKHDITFEEAKGVFDDKKRIQRMENRGGERRWRTVGRILGVVVAVIYTVRVKVFRIISARRASKNEREQYSESQK